MYVCYPYADIRIAPVVEWISSKDTLVTLILEFEPHRGEMVKLFCEKNDKGSRC